MNTILQAQSQVPFLASVLRTVRRGMCVLASVFLLTLLFVPTSTYAAVTFAGGTLVASTGTICGSGTATLTATATSCGSGSPFYTMNYQFETSTDATSWTAIPGASGTFTPSGSAPTVFATYVTPTLTAGSGCSSVYYRVQLTAISVKCPPGTGTDFTLPSSAPGYVKIDICPSAGTLSGPSFVCQYSTASYSASGLAGGTWSTSNPGVMTIGSTGVASVTGTSTVVVTYTAPGGCTATKTVTAGYAAGTLGGNHWVCLGGTNALTYSGGPSGGTFTSDNPSAITVNSSGVTSGIGPVGATATITFTVGGVLGGCTSTYTQTVAPLPAAITGGDIALCTGTSATLSNTTAGGTWLLTSGAGCIGVGNTTGIISGASTTYCVGTVAYQVTTTQCFTSTTITVNPLPTITGLSPTPSICSGASVTLSATPTGGTWVSGNTAVATVGSSSGIVTGVLTGSTAATAPISYTSPEGCTRAGNVLVNPVPTITSAGVVCVGSTVGATSSFGGGTFTISPVTVASLTGTSSTTATITGVSAGTATLSYTLGSTGCRGTTVITVNPLPPAPAGPSSVCVGSTITLTNTEPGGTWSSSLPAQGTVGAATGIVGGIAAGTPFISYTSAINGCSSRTTVTVNALPTVGGTLSTCVGSSSTLTASAAGTWISSNPAVATAGLTDGVVSGVSNGTVTITFTATATSCVRTVTFTVNALPAAITGTTLLCPGQCTTLSSATPGGTWSSTPGTGSVTIGSSTGFVCGASAGTATVSYTLSTGCRATTVLTISATTAPITGTTNMCVGSCTTLANSTPGGTWTSSNTAIATVGASTGIVCGASPGTATITYTFPTSCIATTVVSVNANPPAIGGVASVCLGSSNTLSNATAGGTWSSSAPSIASIGSASGIFTGNDLGTATVTYTLPTGCIATRVVTVYAVPGAISGSPTVCVGNAVAWGNPVAGGTWTSSNTTIATVSAVSGIVTGNSAGTATITYMVEGGCFTTATITVNPVPDAITGATSACIGSTVTLSSTTPGGTWLSGNPSVATVNVTTGVVTGVATGTANITYMLPTTCYTSTVVTVSSAPSPIGGSLSICAGNTTTLSHASPGGTWSSTNAAVGTISTAGVVTGIAAGTTRISYVLPSGCFTSTVVTVNAIPPAIGGPTSVCAGATITLTNAVPGGTWTSSAPGVATIGFSTGIVTGVNPAGGTTTITYTAGTGCFTTTVITVNASPGAISGTFTICVGNCTTLTNATAGGTWSSSNPAVGTVDASTGVVCGISAGTTNITYTTPAGCRAFATVSVTGLPAAITGSLLLCPGNTTTLSSATPGGTWSICGGTGTALILPGSGVITGITEGTVVVCYTTGSGCSVSATVTINALPAPVTGNLSICIGGTTSLTSATPGGTWSSSNVTVATVGSATGVVSGLTVGTSRITYTIPSTGCNVTADVTVNAAPPAIGGTLTVCTGFTTTLTNAASGGTWSSSNTTVATIGATNGVVSGLTPGTTTISYDVSAGCATATVVTVYPTPAAIEGATATCLGESITLTSTTLGGTWSSSNTAVGTIGSSTGVVTPVSAGTTTISYIMPTGCFVVHTLTINSLPAAITGTLEICEGQTTTLSNATPGGGVWSSSNASVATIDATTGVLTGEGGGTATITFVSTATGCFTTTEVTANALPAAITGPTQVCVDGTITLTSATSGGIWNSSDPSVATIDASTGVLLGGSAGVVTITYTLGTGCFITTSVTVNPLPLPIAGSATGCVGVPVTLTASPAGGTWTIAPAAVATVSGTGVVTGVSEGTATVTYTLPTGCFVTRVFTVSPAPEPIAGTAFVCVGGTRTLTSATPGGTWSSANPIIGSVDATTGVVTGVNAGTVRITYTAATGCFVTRVFTVYPIPPAITGTMEVCEGQVTTLSNIITGGTWTSSVPTIATVGSASGVVTGVDGYNTVTITYTLPSSCSVTAEVTVNPLPAAIVGPTAICDSTTAVFTSATPGGTWSSSNPGVGTIDPTTGVFTTLVPGVTIIRYTLTATSCFVTHVLIVNPLPGFIGGTPIVCVGQTTTLTNSLPGGTWSSTNPSVATVAPFVGLVTGINAGNATVIYTVAGCSRSIVVTVNPLPDAIAGPDTVCVASCATLSNATDSGTWSSSNVAIATIDSNGVFCGVSAGTARITYTLPTGCFVTRVISVRPLPSAITGRDEVCLGLTTTLANTTLGGTWSISDPTTLVIDSVTTDRDSIIIRGIDTGTALVIYTLPTGCSRAFIVTVNPLPDEITGPGTVCVGATITLADSSAGGVWTVSPATRATIGGTTGIVTGLTPGTAIVTYTLSTGCIATRIITVNPNPTPITGPSDVCVGSTITLTDTTKFGVWTTADTNIVTVATIDSMRGTVFGDTVGMAIITYTIPTGCFVTDTITVRPLPNVTVNHPSIICRGASVLLTATGAGSGATYTWAPPTGLSCTSCQSTVASPTVTTTYTVTGGTQYGCTDTAVVTVVVDSLLNNIRVTGKDSICAGTCTTLYAEGFPDGSLFAWRPIAGLSCTICDTVVACPDATRTYWAIAIDSIGCRDSASFTVHVMPLPVLDVLPRPAFVCKGDSTQLQAFSSVPGTTFAWFPNIFLTCDSCSNPIAYDTFNLVYRVTGTTPFGCYDSIRVPVSVLENSTNTITSDTFICRGATIQLNATSVNVDGSTSGFLWIPSTGLSANNIPDPVVTPDATRTYSLVITPNACFSDTLTVTVGVAEYPIVEITPEVSNVVAGTQVPLTATIVNSAVVNVSSYAWTPTNSLSCEVCFSTIATPTVNTTYTFTATSNYGCTSYDTARINLNCDNSQVFVPNTFTPNGDGVNDRFFISAKGISTITRFFIVNRWGEVVYDARNIAPNDPAMGWDGTFKGMVLPPDVFMYYLEAQCELGGTPFKYHGDISIVR